MAFCEITKVDYANLGRIVNQKLNQDITKLKNFKSFAKEVFDFIVSKGATQEKAVALVRGIPSLVNDYRAFSDVNRKKFRDKEISMDLIDKAENDHFLEFDTLASYLGLKKESNLFITTPAQTTSIAKVDNIIKSTKVEMVEISDPNKSNIVVKRKINGKLFTHRVTDIAKAGFNDLGIYEDGEDNPALKHGNTIDTIGKNVFDGKEVKYEEFKDIMSEVAFNAVLSQFLTLKKGFEAQGFSFRTGVTVYDAATDISGEIDLLLIDKEGEAYIHDFKTLRGRFNDSSLKVDTLNTHGTETKILSKWNQYATQGYLYSLMLAKMTGLKVNPKMNLIGIELTYDASVPSEVSKIENINKVDTKTLPATAVRTEYKNKSLPEILEEYTKLNKLNLGTQTEAPKRAKKNIQGYTGKKHKLDRVANINEKAASDKELKTEVEWFNNNPIGKDTLLRISDVVNSGLFGNFSLDGITLYKGASKGTAYHEGWHRFSQVFMSQEDKIKLYTSVAEDNIDFTSRDGRKLNTSSANLIDVEEFLAEEFAKYALDTKNYTYPTNNKAPKNLFQRIWDFLLRYFGKNPKPIELFQKLYTGKISEYLPSSNNAFWGNLNSIATKADGSDIVTNDRLDVWKSTFDYLIAKELDDFRKSFVSFKQSKALQKKVLDNVFTELYNKYETDFDNLSDEQANELENILENKYEFINTYLQITEYQSLKGFQVEDDIFSMNSGDLETIEDLIQENSDVEDLYDEDETTESKPERFDRTGNEDAAITLADGAIQDWFRSIPKDEVNELGYPKNHTYYDAFYKVKKVLAGKFELKDMIAALNDPHNQRLVPELKVIAKKLAPFLDNSQETNYIRRIQNMSFLSAFYNVMVMPEISNTQLSINLKALADLNTKKITKATIASYRKAFRSLSLKIIQGWQKDFRDIRGKETYANEFASLSTNKSKLLSSKPLYVSKDNKVYFNPFYNFREGFDKDERTLAGLKRFYNLLGITLNEKAFTDPLAVEKLKLHYDTFISNFSTYSSVMLPDLLALLKKDVIDIPNNNSVSDHIAALTEDQIDIFFKDVLLNNPLQYFSEKKEYAEFDKGKKFVLGSTSPIKFILEELAEIEEVYGSRVSSGAFRIEDKTKYPYYLPNQIGIVTNLLNNVKTLGDFNEQIYLSHLNPNKNPWMKRSYFMKMMFDMTTNKRKELEIGKHRYPINIILEDIVSVKTINTNGEVVEKHPRSLDEDEKFFMDVLTLFSAGAIEVPRSETSSTMFSLRLSAYDRSGKSSLPIPISTGQALPEQFHSILRDYLLSEIEKRQWYLKNEPQNPLGSKLNIFEDILSKEAKDKITELIDGDVETILEGNLGDDKLSTEVKRNIEKYFNGVIQEIKPKFEALSDEQKNILKDTLQSPTIAPTSIAKTFVLNQFVLAHEFYNNFFGDLYFFSNPFKRGKIVTNTGNAMYVDNQKNELLNSLQAETLNSIYTGQTRLKDFRFIKSGVISDIKMTSSYVDNGLGQNRLLTDIINIRTQAGIYNPSDLGKIEAMTDKYKNINIADGQGIVGLDFYKSFSLIAAPHLWTESKEKEYQRQKAIFRSNYSLYFKVDENGEKVKLEGQELEDAKQKDLELASQKPFDFFNPLKISYTGPQAKEGPFKPVFDKFSVRPIIPEAAIGRRDENLLLSMVEQDVDYLKFQSGTKVHQPTDPKFDWFKKVGEGKYDLNDFSINFDTSQTLYGAYLKHQLNTEDVKVQNILGSQFRKIVFGIKYLPHIKNNPTLFKYFSDLENKFIKVIKDLIEIEENDLFTLLGIEKNNNGTYYVKNIERFMKLLNEESKKRGLPVNNIDYLQYSKEKNAPKYELEYAFNRSQIVDLLSGLIDERLRRLQVNGTNLIQVSSAGYERGNTLFTKPTQEQLQRYGSDGLHYYHLMYKATPNGPEASNTSTMGVKVALMGDFEKLLHLKSPTDNKKLGIFDKNGNITDYNKSLARLNEAMNNKNWKNENMKSFIMIGYRIPTQNNNFIDRMEIMEFLPKSAGSIIIAPIEAIIKSGSDFDIDKMNIIKPSINDRGLVVKSPEESIDKIKNNIRKLTDTERDIKKMKSHIEKILSGTENTIVSLIKAERSIRLAIIDLLDQKQADSLIETIMDNWERNPDVPIAKFLEENKESDVFEDGPSTDELLNKTLHDFYTIEAYITNRINKYNEVEKENRALDLKWFNKKKQYKKGKNNEMIDIISELLSHPYYFELLITPSSADTLSSLANDIIASKEDLSDEEKAQRLNSNDGKLYDTLKTPAQNIKYIESNKTFGNFIGKRKDLGGYAIQRTFADIFNYINFTIAKSYVPNKKTGDEKVVHTPLLEKGKRNSDRITMHGPLTKDSFDELISSTVDLATSPFYAHLEINQFNKKIVQYLLHQQVDPKTVVWFVNQPILQELYKLVSKNKNKIKGYTLKHGLVDLALKYKIVDNPPIKEGSRTLKYNTLDRVWVKAIYDEIEGELIEPGYWKLIYDKANPFLKRPYQDLNEYLTDDDEFSLEEMDKEIRKGVQPKNNSDLQKKVLAYFGSTIEEADMLMKLEFAYNTDTTKYSTLTSIMRNRKNKQEVEDSGLFAEHELKRLGSQSMISPFDYTNKAYEIYKSLFPKLYDEDTINTFSNLAFDVFGASNIQLERISKIIENDYIEYIYKNFGTFRGKNLTEYFRPQLNKQGDEKNYPFFSNKFLDLMGKYPELRNIPFVAGIYEDAYFPPDIPLESSYKNLDNAEIRNLFFLRNPDNPTFERNMFTNNWRALINFDAKKLGLKEAYSPEQIGEISSFFHELIYFSLYQSGLTNTSNGFSDLIPYEHWGRFIQQAFTNMEQAAETNSHLYNQLLSAFSIRVKQMNPKIRWRTRYIVTKEVDTETNQNIKEDLYFFKNYYRGKDYKVEAKDLDMLDELYDADSLEDGASVPVPKEKSEHPIEIGRYVKYGEDVYMVIKPTKRSNIWVVYNPTKTGQAAKISISEKNMTALKEKGKIVTLAFKDYIITSKGEVIDMHDFKALPKNSPLIKTILQAPEKKNNNDDETPKVC